MPAPSDEPLRKVTLLLFASDVDGFQRRYGRGWTEQIRLLVRKDMKAYNSLRATLDDAVEKSRD